MNAEIRQQEKVDMAGERNFRRRELLGKYIAKILYKWDNGKFKEEYLRKFKRNWTKWKEKDKTAGETNSFFGSRNLEGGVISELQSLNLSFF